MTETIRQSTASGEEIASHSIRANHELISDLCMAKEALEDINNDLPDVFGLIAHDGQVIRGNSAYARLAGVDLEEAGMTSLQALFSSESWKIINNAVNQSPGDGDPVSMEMPVDAVNPDQLFHWTFSSFRAVSDRRGRLWSFLGKDITKLREIERKLASIFAAIPLGVITINKDLQIEWPYSAYSEVLLGHKKLETLSAEEGLFGHSKRFMSPGQLENMRLLFQQIGAEEEWYDMAKDLFPKEIPFGLDTAIEPTGWRALTYNPIVREGRVEKILIVIEDITDRVRQRMALTSRLTKEQKIAQLIFDLQGTDAYMLENCKEDLETYMAELSKLVQSKAPVKALCNKLHAIKGVARAMNLTTFKDFVHEMEDRLLRNADVIDKGEIRRLQAEFSLLEAEWQEALKYIKIFQAAGADGVDHMGKGAVTQAQSGSTQPSIDDIVKRRTDIMKALQSVVAKNKHPEIAAIIKDVRELTYVDLGIITPKLEAFFGMTANKLGREAALELKWANVKVDYSELASIAELFYHLITNSLDHGIETPEVRESAGKSRVGRVVISAKDLGESVAFECADDGSGINESRVLEIAKIKGLIASEKKIAGPDLWNLILMNGFSTAAGVTDTSGRGIGLDAVNERIKSLGGDGLRVEKSVYGKGMSFVFTIRKQ